MYVCQICGIKFDEPTKVHDNGYNGLPWYSTVDVCPVCGANYRHFTKTEDGGKDHAESKEKG